MVKIRENKKKLLKAASKAMTNAYVLWGFRVGASVLAEDGQIYEGCNVESWISGLGTCAERCAINHAVLHGNRKIKQIAITVDANSLSEPIPCGACLQYIFDFAENPKIEIIMAKVEKGRILFETVKLKTIAELLPSPFKNE
ncbi:MAG: cytidine deaminase [Candidatus Bathyarchaeota archaeon]|nr:cytidine deaminase [Candidatus Bathyarchaeota archaeon]